MVIGLGDIVLEGTGIWEEEQGVFFLVVENHIACKYRACLLVIATIVTQRVTGKMSSLKRGMICKLKGKGSRTVGICRTGKSREGNGGMDN